MQNMNQATLFRLENTFAKLRNNLFRNKNIVSRMFLYFILISLSLIYVEQLFYIISMSFKSYADITDPTATWIPKDPTLNNFKNAMMQMKFLPVFIEGRTFWDSLMGSSLVVSIMTALPSALIQVLTCAVAGYAFARLNFPLKKFMVFLLIFSYIIPPQTTFLPVVSLYKNLGLINSPLAFIIPALFANGIRGNLFIIIYMQYFAKIPKELEEAALLDGANYYRIFLKVMYPLSKPVKITVFLFALVWHWNETYLTSIFLPSNKTLSTVIAGIRLDVGDYASLIDYYSASLLAVRMAGAVLLIAPILLVYAFTQKYYTESIERTGIVE